MVPETSTVAVTVQPGGNRTLGLSLCRTSNNVIAIFPGLIEDLNKVRPGSVEVGDRITEVNGEKGPAFLAIRAWAAHLTDVPEILRLTILRPVEFEVPIDITKGKELGLEISTGGFVREIRCDGMVASYNARQGASGATICVRDRVVEVSGRKLLGEDGDCNVLPYLRLAMCGGASPLRLRVRRGQLDPCEVPKATQEKRRLPIATLCDLKRRYNCDDFFQKVIEPVPLRLLQALRKLGHSTPTPDRCSDVTSMVRKDSKTSSEPSTPSTRASTRGPSRTQSQSSFDCENCSAQYLTLPGVVQRKP
jgi:hypothetical protein